jgi:spore coat polysaccharide biosynthesis protein SpsF
MTKLVVVIQARMGSSRLPGKVLLPLANKPLLERMIERVRAAQTPFELCVATTFLAEDDPIVALCRRVDAAYFRGHPHDLLDRHWAAGRAHRAGAVVKIPSDCPLIDPAAVDRVLGTYLATEGRYDLVTNLNPPTWPDGNDVEVVPLATLETAFVEAAKPHEREHTTPFIWERPERFSIRNVTWETGRDYSSTHRFTIDYPEDYAFIAAVYEALGGGDEIFGLAAILELLERQPKLRALNARFLGTSWRTRLNAEPSRSEVRTFESTAGEA